MISNSAPIIGRFRGFLDFDFSAGRRIMFLSRSTSDQSSNLSSPLRHPALYRNATRSRASVSGMFSSSAANSAGAMKPLRRRERPPDCYGSCCPRYCDGSCVWWTFIRERSFAIKRSCRLCLGGIKQDGRKAEARNSTPDQSPHLSRDSLGGVKSGLKRLTMK